MAKLSYTEFHAKYWADPERFNLFITTLIGKLSDLTDDNALTFLVKERVTLDDFIQKRIEARNKSNKSWPKSLSKKEVIVCKLNYIKFLLENSDCAQDSAHHEWYAAFKKSYIQILSAAVAYIFSVGYDGTTSKFKGIDPQLAKILNILNDYYSTAFNKCVEENIEISLKLLNEFLNLKNK